MAGERKSPVFLVCLAVSIYAFLPSWYWTLIPQVISILGDFCSPPLCIWGLGSCGMLARLRLVVGKRRLGSARRSRPVPKSRQPTSNQHCITSYKSKGLKYRCYLKYEISLWKHMSSLLSPWTQINFRCASINFWIALRRYFNSIMVIV